MKITTALMIVLSLFAVREKGNANAKTYSYDTIPGLKALKMENDSLIFSTKDKEAVYPGSAEAWTDFLSAELNADIPVRNGAKPGTYKVAVQFIIEPDGMVSHVLGLTHIGFGMEREAERVIKKSKRWEPAIQNGRYVRAYRKQIITFNVAEVPKKRIKFSDLFSRDKK